MGFFFFWCSFSNKQLLCRCVFLTSQLLRWKSKLHWERGFFSVWFGFEIVARRQYVNALLLRLLGYLMSRVYFNMTSLNSWLAQVLPHSSFIEAGWFDCQLNPLSAQELEPGVASPELKSATLQDHLLYVSPQIHGTVVGPICVILNVITNNSICHPVQSCWVASLSNVKTLNTAGFI